MIRKIFLAKSLTANSSNVDVVHASAPYNITGMMSDLFSVVLVRRGRLYFYFYFLLSQPEVSTAGKCDSGFQR